MRSVRLEKRGKQAGAALIVLVTVLVVGIAWYTVGALGKSPRSAADREIRTGLALASGKRALLEYMAGRAARSDNDIPGRLPCPEPLSPAAGGEGLAAGCSDNTRTFIGRLPWRTLGVDQIRDGDGEPLWYILGSGFRQSPINFGSPGAVELDGVNNAAVALIIAPGTPLETTSEPGTPPAGCAQVSQHPRIPVAGTFDPARFLECGRSAVPAAGTEPQYVTTNAAPWTNDRIIAISAAELMGAIAGPLADRLQRTVAPVLANWDQAEQAVRGKSWGTSWGYPYLPYASAFTDPATNDYCGDAGSPPTREGLPPLAANGSGTCSTKWSGSASLILGLVFVGCADNGTHLVCSFQRTFGTAPFSARISATAPRVAGSFRGTVLLSDITATGGGTVSLSSLSFSSSTGAVDLVIDVTWPASLAVLAVVEVRIPHLPDAVFLSEATHASFAATRWFRDNYWARYTYYAVAPSATLSPTAVCNAAGDPGCLEVRGLASSTGDYWNKRLALVLAGTPLAGQSRSCATDVNANSIADCSELAQYFEEHNASAGDRIYRADVRIPTPSAAATPYPAFNDWAAACPFQQTTQNGAIVTVCD